MRHIADHDASKKNGNVLLHSLKLPCRKNISDAAALAVVLDTRPLSFTENKEGIAALLRAVFEAGQSMPCGVKVDPKSYTPSRTAIMNSLREMAKSFRDHFRKSFKWKSFLSEVQCRSMVLL